MSNPLQSGKKLHWVDAAKGLGAILVILGHLLYGSTLPLANRVIYSFHVPLFFVLGGYLQKPEVRRGTIAKKAQRILLPFLAFALISIPYFELPLLKRGYPLVDMLMDAFYVKGRIGNNPLWFLPVTFEISLVVTALRLPGRNRLVLIAAYLVSVCLGWVVYIHPETKVVLNYVGLNRMIVCLSFYVLGMILRSCDELPRPLLVAVMVVGLGLNVVFGAILNGKVSVYGLALGTYPYFQLAGIGGSIATMAFCKLVLDRPSLLTELSSYTVLLLGSQYFAIVPFKKLMKWLGLYRTTIYDASMVLLAIPLIVLLPYAYRLAATYVPPIRVLNGEAIIHGEGPYFTRMRGYRRR